MRAISVHWQTCNTLVTMTINAKIHSLGVYPFALCSTFRFRFPGGWGMVWEVYLPTHTYIQISPLKPSIPQIQESQIKSSTSQRLFSSFILQLKDFIYKTIQCYHSIRDMHFK